jgi:hypothetical protein
MDTDVGSAISAGVDSFSEAAPAWAAHAAMQITTSTSATTRVSTRVILFFVFMGIPPFQYTGRRRVVSLSAERITHELKRNLKPKKKLRA